jgi:glycosyltransferase involved in cell wall biosynthesis
VIEQALLRERVVVETATTDDDGVGQHIDKALGCPLQENGVTRWYFRKNTEFYKCSWLFSSWVARHVRDYDLLHIHALFSFTSSAAAWAARRARVPYVIRPLGVLSRYGIKNRLPGLKQASLRIIERPIIECAAAMHFTSDMERREAEALGYAMRSVVIPLALPSIDAHAFSDVDPLNAEVSGIRTVLFLSRLDPKKNVEGLLAAFAEVTHRLPGVVLVVAGSGDPSYVAELKVLGARLGLSEKVSWPGHVQGDAKATLLRRATAFVLPSYSENFGIAVAEALAAGLPCIVGRGVALAESVARAGAGVVVSEDATSIGAALLHVLSVAGLRAEMAMNARVLAEAEFSDAVMGQRLCGLYRRILREQDKGATRT